MTIKTALDLAAIEDLNTKLTLLSAQNAYNPYEKRTYQPVFEESPYKGATDAVYGYFCRLYRATRGGIIEAKISTIAKHTKYNKRTVIRAIKKLEADGVLLVFRYWRNSYIFVSPNQRIENVREQIKVIVSQAIENETKGQNVTKLVSKCHQDTYIVNESFHNTQEPISEPPPDPPPDPPRKQPPEKNKPSAVFFYKNTQAKLKTYSDEIAMSCTKIMRMPGYTEKTNIITLVKWAIKNKMHPKAISESLKYVTTFNNLTEVDPYAILKSRSKLKTQRYTAEDAEAESYKRKQEAMENGKIVLVMKGI